MILMIYNEEVLHEILLPNVYDTDYPILLSGGTYALRRDLTLRLERTEEGWFLHAAEDEYEIHAAHQIVPSHRFADEDLIRIVTPFKERLYILSSIDETRFQQMEKYDLTALSEISIGRNASSAISYRFLGLVSQSHAVLSRRGNTWYVTDFSKNGVFLDGKRIRGERRLSFGDRIDLFGLVLMYMGHYLLVGVHCGEIHVDESLLIPADLPVIDRARLLEQPPKEEEYFNRSPRNLPILYSQPVEIEGPPAPQIEKKKPVYMVIGPAFTMAIPMFLGCLMMVIASRMRGGNSGVFMYAGLVTALGAAAVGTVWAVLNMNYSQEESRRNEEARFNAYSNYLIEAAYRLRAEYQHNVQAMHAIYPSAEACASYTRYTPELWNRNPSHADFLYERVGVGDAPFQVDIRIPEERFTLVSDTLQNRPREIRDEYQTLHGVPCGISLMENRLIGLVGGPGKYGAIEMMHVLTAGIAASHSYTDVKLVYIYSDGNPDTLADWECMRNFPHVWSEDHSFRYMAASETEIRDVFFELGNILRGRLENASAPGSRGGAAPRPHYVIFIHDPLVLKNEMLTRYLYDARPELGITTLLLVETVDQLPNECETVIEVDSFGQRIFNLMEVDRGRWQNFVPDRVSADALLAMGSRLANIHVKEVETVSGIPQSLGFLEMYHARTPAGLLSPERWRKNRNYNSMKVPVGRKAGDTECWLDIHEKYHGPHGLVAGTTGSGKSETLQTFILSLAVNFSPEDVSFFIIDFKGGGMANLFERLPHLSGQISNLSGNQVRRAMISIKSENTRRQRLFAQYGVNNINLYTRLYKNHEARIPIPHLIIVIDEFAELKREEPEFMSELISVAQVGRSLGVHLILATQKPAGTVDDNIWSNSRFRLCLRVQDRQDSLDMLHRPDAAFLTQAGRCYLQVGNDELFELFQSAYSGAVYREDVSASSRTSMVGRTGKADMVGRLSQDAMTGDLDPVHKMTELDAVIEYLRDVSVSFGYGKSSQLWLPVLPAKLLLDDLPEGGKGFDGYGWPDTDAASLAAPIGLYDDPAHQYQGVLRLCFADCGHLAVCGAVVSGKSTFLQTLVYSFLSLYTPSQLQMYLIDFSSHLLTSFAPAPQVGGVVTDQGEDRLEKLMNLLQTMMNERKERFRGGNFSQYIQVYGQKIPAVFVVIDNYAAFREKTKDRYESTVMRIAREGIGYGIYLILSAGGFGISEIPSRLGDQIRTVISLEMPDKFRYMETLHLTRLPILPEAGVRGRGLAKVGEDVLEFQTALSVDAADDFERGQHLEEASALMAKRWTGQRARPIPEIPENPAIADLDQAEGMDRAIADPLLLPVGYRMQDASVYSMDLARNYCIAVTGKARSGKTNTLKVLLHYALQKGAKAVLIESSDSGFFELPSGEPDVRTVRSDAELFAYFKELTPEFVRRNQKKHALMKEGLDEDAIAREMSHERPIFHFIADLADFIHMVYQPGEGVGGMSGFVETILSKGALHNIFFAASLKVEDEAVLVAYKAYASFVSAKKGIHLGGNLAGQRLFHFQNVPFAEQSKPMKRGMAYIADDEEESSGNLIVIPSAKRDL